MSVTRATVRSAAKRLIQDALPNSGTGAQFLLNDPIDYNTGIAQALRLFDADVANHRIAHVVMSAVVFRLALAGTGAILPPQKVPLPVATLIGTGGAKVRSYRVAARNTAGQGLWSDAVLVTTAPNTLDGTHKIKLDWAALPGATSYDVYGRDEGQEQLIANTASTTYTDDGSVVTPSGALSTDGLDAWVIDGSSLDAVWFPYFAGASPTLASQGQTALDDNEWLIRQEPGPLVLLELSNISTTIGQTLRLEFTSPHVLDENSAAYSSIPFTKIEALQTLVAAVMLRMVANRYLQNSGSTGLPSDIVDRRSQSDQAASRAKDYFTLYRDMVGGGDAANSAASGFADLDALSSHNRGFLWHPTNIR